MPCSLCPTHVKIEKTLPSLNPVITPSPLILNGTPTATAGAADSLSGIDSQCLCDTRH
jgi:hypothetical protein